MTNREIKLELAKAVLSSNRQIEMTLQDVYEWILKDEEEDVDTPKTDYDDKPIGEVVRQITEGSYYYHKYAVRLEKVFANNNIKTVGDLLRYGRFDFSKLQNVGRGSLARIDDALEELYGIKTW